MFNGLFGRAHRRLRARDCLALLLGALATACSTARPVPNARMGLLDRIGKLSPAHRSTDPEYRRAYRGISSERMIAAKKAAASWLWPLSEVQVTSFFGTRGSSTHEGLDLRAPVGTPVRAVQAGKVLYSGSGMRGYGRLVILKHSSGLSTLYAHNSRLLVRVGQTVRQGQRIAVSGRSGRARGPHLHFEIRYGEIPVDPLLLLPAGSQRLAEEASPAKRQKVAFQSER